MSYYPHPQPFYGTIIESEYGLVGLVAGGSVSVCLADNGLCYPILDEEGNEYFYPNSDSSIEETLPNGENSSYVIEELTNKLNMLSNEIESMKISPEEKVLSKHSKNKAKNSSKKASFPATAKASCGGGKSKKTGAKVATDGTVVIPYGIKSILVKIASSDAEAEKFSKSVDETPNEHELSVMAFFMMAFFIQFPSRQQFAKTAYSKGPFFIERSDNIDKNNRLKMHIIVLRIFSILALKTEGLVVSDESITEHYQNVVKDPASGAYRGKPNENEKAFNSWCKSIRFDPATDRYSAMYPAAHTTMQEFATRLRVVQDRNFENPETKGSIDASLAFCETFLADLLSRP